MPAFLKPYCAGIPQRFVVCVIATGVLFICSIELVTHRSAILEMTFQPPRDETKVIVDGQKSCPIMIPTVEYDKDSQEKALYFWDQSLIRAISQAYYIGSMIAPIPAGMMADFYGPRNILGAGFLVSMVITLMYPTLADVGPYQLLLGRLLQGICYGMLWPSVAVLVAQWAPQSERSTFSGIMEAGWPLAAVLGRGLLPGLSYLFSDGWEAKVYLVGVIGMFWCLALFILVYSDPASCPHISATELDYISKSTEGLTLQEVPLYPFVPWKQMFKSPPFLSMILFDFGLSWVRYTLSLPLRRYLDRVIHLTSSLTTTCLTIAVSAAVISSVFYGIISDWLVNQEVISRTTSRKLFGFLGNILVLPFLLLVPFAGCDGILVSTIYSFAYYMQGIGYSCFRANPIDLCPQHAGVATGVIQCVIGLAIIFSRETFYLICGYTSNSDPYKILFLINGGVVLICSLPYLWFCSAEVQPWNYLHRPTSMAQRRSFNLY